MFPSLPITEWFFIVLVIFTFDADEKRGLSNQKNEACFNPELKGKIIFRPSNHAPLKLAVRASPAFALCFRRKRWIGVEIIAFEEKKRHNHSQPHPPLTPPISLLPIRLRRAVRVVSTTAQSNASADTSVELGTLALPPGHEGRRTSGWWGSLETVFHILCLAWFPATSRQIWLSSLF